MDRLVNGKSRIVSRLLTWNVLVRNMARLANNKNVISSRLGFLVCAPDVRAKFYILKRFHQVHFQWKILISYSWVVVQPKWAASGPAPRPCAAPKPAPLRQPGLQGDAARRSPFLAQLIDNISTLSVQAWFIEKTQNMSCPRRAMTSKISSSWARGAGK